MKTSASIRKFGYLFSMLVVTLLMLIQSPVEGYISKRYTRQTNHFRKHQCRIRDRRRG